MLDAANIADIQGALVRADFGLFCEQALAPLGMSPAKHHRVVIDKLQAVAEGGIRRLMLLMPPGSAKSTYASILFPAWYLARRPRLTMVAASNTAKLANDFSIKAQRIAADNRRSLNYTLNKATEDYWLTSQGCEYKCVGARAAVAGRRADVALIDDPFGSREEANSETIREKTWNWYRGDIVGRLKPGGSVVLVNTHWHEDDLTGRLRAEAANGGLPWDVVLMQAIYDGAVVDPIERQIGEALWPEWEDIEELTQKRQAVGELEWAALFQQNPQPPGGSLFKVGKIEPLPVAPIGGRVVRAWDLAATSQTGTKNPDWTAGVKLARMPNGRFVIQDVRRIQGGPDERDALILNTAKADGPGVQIGIPQDPGQAGKVDALHITRMLTGFRVESSPESGDKETRAGPVASQINVGNFDMVAGPWNEAFTAELAAFPSGRKKDQVDALSRAFMMIGVARPPMRIDPAEAARF